jgi:hypothetical protein
MEAATVLAQGGRHEGRLDATVRERVLQTGLLQVNARSLNHRIAAAPV